MSKETFVFTSSTLRSLRLQQEMLDWEERKRAASRQYASWRYQPNVRRNLSLPKSTRYPKYCRDPAVHNALYTGDLPRIQSIFNDEITANLIVETVSEELVWSTELGLWVLTPQKKHTSPLRITVARGYRDCVKHLLLQGAEVDAVIGGKAALHDSSANHRAECTRLLLRHNANPNIFSDDGLTPLHLCTTQETLPCAQLLLEYGALVNQNTRDRRISPLHVAAKHGLDDHLKLYLCYGANIAHRNREGETALNTACASTDRPEDAGRYYQVVKRLLEGGADVHIAGRKNHTPLHNACSNCHIRIVELLLQHGADVNVSNCAGYTPMDCALQAVEDYLDGEPERVIATLLNHGAGPVNPKMLKFCALSPRAMEVVLNSYDRVLSCDSWVGSVPPEVWQEHQTFYDSALSLVNQPRPLQHLARCAVRKQLGVQCHSGIAQLKLPSSLQDYLYLPLEGYLK
ncbi:ankyrin repeat and SOCS box protein 16 [Varanus komodoensis]|uniref:ankyrin repeat and SOCS box protein 16 n=1 Tax=Varanus komodoensis TaxID=61221 RepID=UPI001CF7A01F|nr:ankyrin repeat and SOCS box protein 16 [Varanus komodoensis]